MAVVVFDADADADADAVLLTENCENSSEMLRNVLLLLCVYLCVCLCATTFLWDCVMPSVSSLSTSVCQAQKAGLVSTDTSVSQNRCIVDGTPDWGATRALHSDVRLARNFREKANRTNGRRDDEHA